MEKYMKLQKYADKLITSHHIITKSKHKIIKQIGLYLDAVIFNIISVFCLIAILNTPATEAISQITNKTIDVGKKYIDDTCKPKPFAQSGGDGRMGSATFLGNVEPMYSAANPTNDILHMDFQGGIARPQIGGSCSTGGTHKPTLELHKVVDQYIKDVLGYHKVTAKREIKKAIFGIITNHIDCFIADLIHHRGILTISALKKIAKSHKILHPPKTAK